jgi:hypothetical protein
MPGTVCFQGMAAPDLTDPDAMAGRDVAMSCIYKTMVDGSNDIQVEGPTAGSVYALDLRPGLRDDLDDPIDSEWMAVRMAGIEGLTGVDLAKAEAPGNLAIRAASPTQTTSSSPSTCAPSSSARTAAFTSTTSSGLAMSTTRPASACSPPRPGPSRLACSPSTT